MNGYNFDYLDYLNTMPNYIPNDNMYSNNITSSIYDGFIRGNMFDNLYLPYKDYKVKTINPSSEKDALLLQLMQYKFALTDLDLYLDVNPNDNNALNMYKDYLNIMKQIESKYENSYGPLSLDNNSVINGSWNWINNSFPWEGVNNV